MRGPFRSRALTETDAVDPVGGVLRQIMAIVESQQDRVRGLESTIEDHKSFTLSLHRAYERLMEDYASFDELVELADVLQHRNQYGMTEAEARLAHLCIQVGLHGLDERKWSRWEPWPLCHCQADLEASADAAILRDQPYESPLIDRLPS